jgi:hypothetical protein
MERVAREARRLMLRPPGEHLQFDVAICAPFGELGPRRAIDMNLPNHPREGGEIIRALAGHSRKPTAAMHVTGEADAERHSAIIEGNL